MSLASDILGLQSTVASLTANLNALTTRVTTAEANLLKANAAVKVLLTALIPAPGMIFPPGENKQNSMTTTEAQRIAGLVDTQLTLFGGRA